MYWIGLKKIRFSVELLVGGKPLKECSEPADKSTVSIKIKTGVSYVFDQNTNERIESDRTFYAVINQVDKTYEIQFGASKELFAAQEQSQPAQPAIVSFKAKIYVDGQWDHSWRLINKPNKLKKVGFNSSKRKKTPLTFDLSKWEENDDKRIEKENDVQDDDNAMRIDKEYTMNDNENASNDEKKMEGQDRLGYGAISVYLFNTNDIEKNEYANPLAALHIHYRPKQWLLERNILFEEMLSEITDNTQESRNDGETPQENIQDIKKVKFEKKKANLTKKGRNRKDRERDTQADTMEVEEPEGNTSEAVELIDIPNTQEIVENAAVEEVQVAKKTSRGRKGKKVVEKTKETETLESNAETGTRRYNLRARK
ncbi:4682_t:CDS:2 [Funneliformis geosporum]|nr:4682_t:CDS:2 [Funneliformis geosporum]